MWIIQYTLKNTTLDHVFHKYELIILLRRTLEQSLEVKAQIKSPCH